MCTGWGRHKTHVEVLAPHSHPRQVSQLPLGASESSVQLAAPRTGLTRHGRQVLHDLQNEAWETLPKASASPVWTHDGNIGQARARPWPDGTTTRGMGSPLAEQGTPSQSVQLLGGWGPSAVFTVRGHALQKDWRATRPCLPWWPSGWGGLHCHQSPHSQQWAQRGAQSKGADLESGPTLRASLVSKARLQGKKNTVGKGLAEPPLQGLCACPVHRARPCQRLLSGTTVWPR